MAGFDDFVEDLKKAVVNAKTLEITTAVGPIGWNAEKQDYIPVADATVKVMRTKIDLFEGDILTQIDQEFATASLQSLRDYHMQTQTAGHDIIRKNVEALEALFSLVKNIKKG